MPFARSRAHARSAFSRFAGNSQLGVDIGVHRPAAEGRDRQVHPPIQRQRVLEGRSPRRQIDELLCSHKRYFSRGSEGAAGPLSFVCFVLFCYLSQRGCTKRRHTRQSKQAGVERWRLESSSVVDCAYCRGRPSVCKQLGARQCHHTCVCAPIPSESLLTAVVLSFFCSNAASPLFFRVFLVKVTWREFFTALGYR